MKAWIYNFYIISKVSWELQVYEFPITYIRDLESIINRYLKKWFKLARCASPTVIYRNTDNYGLGLKKLETVYKKLKVGNAHHLKYNPDSNCAALYQAKMEKERDLVTGGHLKCCQRQSGVYLSTILQQGVEVVVEEA